MTSSVVLLGMLFLFCSPIGIYKPMMIASVSTSEKKKKWNNMATGHVVARLFEALRYKPGRSRVRLPMV